MAKLYQKVRVNTREMLLASNKEKVDEAYADIQSIIEELNTLCESFEKTATTQEAQDSYNNFMATRKSYGTCLETFYNFCVSNKDEEANTYLHNDMKMAGDAEEAAIDAMVTIKVDAAAQKAQDNSRVGSSSVQSMIVLIIFAVIMATTLGIVISRVIGNPLKVMLHAANSIAEGNLDIDIKGNTKDEVGALAKAVRMMSDN
ncbi:hypothetical protein CG709_10670, partial [Lachnotalea glycerini]